MSDLTVDVVVIGGGPAGLAASLALGRAVKRVLLSDGGTRRNARAEHMHGFVTRDGIPPAEFRRIGRSQLGPYDVMTHEAGVAAIERSSDGELVVRMMDGTSARCRRVLLAMGLVDEVPSIEGLRELWGQSVFSCPYCHGWELRARPWGVLATEAAHLEYALLSRGWTDDLVVFTNGAFTLTSAQRDALASSRIRIEARPLRRLMSDHDGRLKGVELDDRAQVPLAALVVRPKQRQTELVRRLDLALDERGLLITDADAQTSMPGVHAAGDLSEPVQAAIVAAAAGTRAAYRMNLLLNTTPIVMPSGESRGARG